MNPPDAPMKGRWLNRTVVGAGLTSFLADVSYETATAVLPGFFHAIGASAFALGLVEGLADAVSSFVKLGAARLGDRLGRRKAIVVAGYLLSGCTSALFPFAFLLGWPIVLVGRVLGWLGKGIRGPLRNAILAEAVAPEDRGKVFGFHRAGDTLGAVVGPLLGAGFLGLLALWAPNASGLASSQSILLWLTLLPGLGAAAVFGLLIRERPMAAKPPASLAASLRALPPPFRRFLVGVGVFGAGDFSHTLLLFAAAEALRPTWGAYAAAAISISLRAWGNVWQAAASFPVGALSDRIGRRGLLVAGYLLGGLVMIAFMIAFAGGFASLAVLLVLMALAGVYLAVEEALESAMTADLVPQRELRNTAYGVLGTVNGLGDFLSSVLVGAVWTFVPAIGFPLGFAYAAILMFAGTVLLIRVR